MKALSSEWTTSSYGFNSIYQIKEQLEQQKRKTNYFSITFICRYRRATIKHKLQVSSFLDFVRDALAAVESRVISQASDCRVLPPALTNTPKARAGQQTDHRAAGHLKGVRLSRSNEHGVQKRDGPHTHPRLHFFEHPVTRSVPDVQAHRLKKSTPSGLAGHHFSKRELEHGLPSETTTLRSSQQTSRHESRSCSRSTRTNT